MLPTLLSILVASPWLAGDMSEAGPHPRSLASPHQREMLQARIEREPYTKLFRTIVSQAGREPRWGDHEISPSRHKAEIARSAAYLHWIDRTLVGGLPAPFTSPEERAQMGRIAVDCALDMFTESRAKGLVGGILDIHTAQELHLWADTLDLLLADDVPDVLGPDREAVVQNVADLAADFYADFNISNWLGTRALVNNHRSKSASALGLAAIVLNGMRFDEPREDGRYEPARWIDFALRYLDFSVADILTDADGGFQEGGGYVHYAGIDHYPFMRAWHRYTGAAGYLTDWSGEVPPFYSVGTEGSYHVGDPWSSEWNARQLRWALSVMLPDGTFPPVDDCTPGVTFFWGAFVNETFSDAGLFRWAWERTGYSAGGSVDLSAFLIETFDDSIPSLSPADAGLAPDFVLPYAGHVVFRSGWGPDDRYVLLQAEHGKAAAWSQTRFGQLIDGSGGHEHADPGSFLLHAGDEPLVIDSGYLGWDARSKVNAPTNHNLILVDGRGPQHTRLVVPPFDVDPDTGDLVLADPSIEGGYCASLDGQAYVTSHDIETPGARHAEIVTDYHVNAAPTHLRRRFTWLSNRALVIHDTVTSLEETPIPRRYTHQLHLNCGGTSDGLFEKLEHGALCTRDGVRLRAAVLSPRGVDQTTREDIHDRLHWEERTHLVLESHVTAISTPQEPVEFMTVLVVEDETTQGFEESRLRQEAGQHLSWQVAGDDCRAWARPISFSLGAGEPDLAPRAGASCRRANEESGVLFEPLGQTMGSLGFWVALYDDGLVSDWRVTPLSGDLGGNELVLPLPSLPGKSPDKTCGDRDDPPGFVLRPGVVVGPAEAARALVAHLALGNRRSGEPAVVPIRTIAVLDASGSCGDGIDGAEFHFDLLRAPEMSLATSESLRPLLEDGRHVTFWPDMPGVYEVGLTLTRGDATDSFVLAFEAEGETTWPPPKDPTIPADTPEELPAGCGGCSHGGGHGAERLLILAWSALAALPIGRRIARRRASSQHVANAALL